MFVTAEQILSVLSITAIVSTVSLFLCGFPICWEIWRRKGTKDISGVPFIMGLIGGCFWLRYGFLRGDSTMITVNVIGVSLFTFYSTFYLAMSNPRLWFGVQLLLSLSLIFAMLVAVLLEGDRITDLLGFSCMTFNIAGFASPLAGLGVVLRTRCCDTLPLPMCVANLLVSSQWMFYGVLIADVYVISPNACGIIFALLQLSLFIIFPRKPTGKAPLGRLCSCLTCTPDVDFEKGAKDSQSSTSKHKIRDMDNSLDCESGMALLSDSPKTVSSMTASGTTTGCSTLKVPSSRRYFNGMLRTSSCSSILARKHSDVHLDLPSSGRPSRSASFDATSMSASSSRAILFETRPTQLNRSLSAPFDLSSTDTQTTANKDAELQIAT